MSEWGYRVTSLIKKICLFQDVMIDHVREIACVAGRDALLLVVREHSMRSTVRNPSCLIPPATYGVTCGPPYVDHSQSSPCRAEAGLRRCKAGVWGSRVL